MPFDPVTFLVVLAVAVGSVGVTALLSLRWTRYRRLYQLHEWCRERRLRLVRKAAQFPPLPPLLASLDPPLRVRWLIRDDDEDASDDDLTLLRAQTPAETYNLLLVRIPPSGAASAWPASALRPTSRSKTVVDLLPLFSYPSTMGVDRFTLHGQSPGAARKLNESHARGLLPRDVGLILADDLLMLDFSDRPFDRLEFDRMILLGRQLARSVPGSRTAKSAA